MRHANIFTLPRPIVCMNKISGKLFLKTGSLIFSKTYKDELEDDKTDVYSIKSIDEKGDIQKVIDDYSRDKPIYIGFAGETISPFSEPFVESVKAAGTTKISILNLIDKLNAYGINVNKDATAENFEIILILRTVDDILHVETTGWRKDDDFGVPYELNDFFKYVNGRELYTDMCEALTDYYAIFNKPKTIIIKEIFSPDFDKNKNKIREIIREFKEYVSNNPFITDGHDINIELKLEDNDNE